MRADRLVLACCVWAALCACSDAKFRELDFSDQSTPPATVELAAEHVRLVEGIAAEARVSALDTEGEPMPVLTFESDDEDVFGVDRGPALGRWVFYGVAPGKAHLEIYSDGQKVGRLPVTVAAQ